jgi:PHD/YefM family antitoxin component YafN of YafNO toxin-antitoxin module
MKTIDLASETPGLDALIELARREPVLLLTQDGEEFCLAEADDFEKEVELLRSSPAFQRFLDERSACRQRIPLEEIEKELNEASNDRP